MQNFPIRILFLILIYLMNACDSSSEEYSVGKNGEPPQWMKQIYSRQFVAKEKNYVRTLGEIHTFLIENNFIPDYKNCFNAVLDIRTTANEDKYNETFPCIALQAEKGSPTKVYLTYLVDEVKFNQLDHNNHFVYTINIYGDKDVMASFYRNVEHRLLDKL